LLYHFTVQIPLCSFWHYPTSSSDMKPHMLQQ